MRQKVPLEVKMEALRLLQSGESAHAVSKQTDLNLVFYSYQVQKWQIFLVVSKKNCIFAAS